MNKQSMGGGGNASGYAFSIDFIPELITACAICGKHISGGYSITGGTYSVSGDRIITTGESNRLFICDECYMGHKEMGDKR